MHTEINHALVERELVHMHPRSVYRHYIDRRAVRLGMQIQECHGYNDCCHDVVNGISRH